MNKWIGFAVGSAVVGFVAYQLYTTGAWGDQYLTKDKKFLYFIPTDDQMGIDDVARGAVLIAAAAMAVKLARGVGLPVSTASPV